MRGSVMNNPDRPGEPDKLCLQKHDLSKHQNQQELSPQGFNNWRGSPQVGSQEPGNEGGSLQKHYSLKARIRMKSPQGWNIERKSARQVLGSSQRIG